MGKTVTTYLIDGDPKGTQYAFISNKICQMFVVPRSNLSYLNTQEKLQKPAFYILLGEDESTKPQAYIGETENFKERVKDHDSKKAFWQKALIFVSKDADMTKVDVQYLEYKAIAEAKKANAFVLSDNKQIPKAPNLPEHQQDSIDEFFEDVKFLASFIGLYSKYCTSTLVISASFDTNMSAFCQNAFLLSWSFTRSLKFSVSPIYACGLVDSSSPSNI